MGFDLDNQLTTCGILLDNTENILQLWQTLAVAYVLVAYGLRLHTFYLHAVNLTIVVNEQTAIGGLPNVYLRTIKALLHGILNRLTGVFRSTLDVPITTMGNDVAAVGPCGYNSKQ